MAALLLDPEVGARGCRRARLGSFERAAALIKQATSEAAESHPAVVALDRLGMVGRRRRARRRARNEGGEASRTPTPRTAEERG